MSDMSRLYTIGHQLDCIKVTFKRDIRIQIQETKISGKEGELVSLPRWIADVLAQQNLVIYDKSSVISALKQALSKEKMIGEYNLATLDLHFYIKLKDAASTLDRYDYDKVEGMLLELFRKRRGKLVKIADSTNLNAELINKLAIEEREFYRLIRENSVKFEQELLK